MSQDKIFQSSEGNQYYARNQTALGKWDPATDFPMRLLDLYQIKPARALEIGAANGFRLAEINRRYGSRVVAVEPSLDAISEGKQLYPAVKYLQGVGSNLPVSGTFDLVIINFVLHWVDRGSLLQTAAEIDRVLDDGGYLVLGDFFPATLLKVPYHHLPGQHVFTFKQNYADLFTGSGIYHSVALLTGHHALSRPKPDVEEHERIAVWLLRKQATHHHVQLQN